MDNVRGGELRVDGCSGSCHYQREGYRASPSEVGHSVRATGILSPLVIGELANDSGKKWRFIRVSSVAFALNSEDLHIHGLQRLRLEREAHRERRFSVPVSI